MADLRTPPDAAKTRSGPVVVFDDVSIRFDVKPVLENISFQVDPGQQLIILGPAGTGKSVLLKLVDGLLEPDSGTITVFGENITTMRETDRFKLRNRIGMVFQESALFDSLTVEDNVAYRLNEERVPQEESHKRVEEVLNFVALPTAISKFPSELFRRHAPPRLHRPRYHHETRPDFSMTPQPADWTRSRPPPSSNWSSRAAGCLPYHLSAHHTPAPGRLHPGHQPVQR